MTTLPDAERLLVELADQMRKDPRPGTALVGIYTGGVWVAERLHRMLALPAPIGTIDVAFWRDDYKKTGMRPGVKPSDIRFEVEGADIILVDDVLYTGRSVRAALDALRDVGRPRAVQLAVFVDRGHREFPLRADYVGKNVPTSRSDNIKVRLTEPDGYDGVAIASHGGPVR